MNQALSVQTPSDLKVLGLDGTKLSVSYVGVSTIQCCIAGLVNDPKYLRRNRDRHKNTIRRSACVALKLRKATSRIVEEFAASSRVCLAANGTPHSDEELYVDYGSDCCFDG